MKANVIQHAEIYIEVALILDHGFTASRQKPGSASTTCACVKPAAVSISGNPLFGCPE